MKEKVKHLLSFLLHGERPPIYAQVTTQYPYRKLLVNKA
jgi:hypothetical protein